MPLLPHLNPSPFHKVLKRTRPVLHVCRFCITGGGILQDTLLPLFDLCGVIFRDKERSNIIRTKSAFVFKVISEQAQLLCCLSTSHIVVPGWEDEDVLIVGYTEDPSRKRRKVADEGVCLCDCFSNIGVLCWLCDLCRHERINFHVIFLFLFFSQQEVYLDQVFEVMQILRLLLMTF